MTVVAGGGKMPRVPVHLMFHIVVMTSQLKGPCPFLQMLCSWGSIFCICRETQTFHFWRKLNFCSVSYLKTTVSAEASWKTSIDAITAIYQAWNFSAFSDHWIHNVDIPLSADVITWLSRDAWELVSASLCQHKCLLAGSGYLLRPFLRSHLYSCLQFPGFTLDQTCSVVRRSEASHAMSLEYCQRRRARSGYYTHSSVSSSL